MAPRRRAATRAEGPLHPIAAVALRTGLPPEVIRVWERRYGAVRPLRDESGTRVYSDEEVERLRLLARATEGGRRIGQVVKLETAALRQLVEEDRAARRPSGESHPPADATGAAAPLDLSLGMVQAMDAQGLGRELNRLALSLGLPRFLDGVLAPLFRRIGDEWHAGRVSIAQEHMATSVARTLLGQLAAGGGPEAGPRLLVATLAGERHEIGALIVAALAQTEGWSVTYLGPDLPPQEIAAAADGVRADVVAVSVVSGAGGTVAAQLQALRSALPARVAVLVGGGAAEALADVQGVERPSGISELRGYLALARAGRNGPP